MRSLKQSAVLNMDIDTFKHSFRISVLLYALTWVGLFEILRLLWHPRPGSDTTTMSPRQWNRKFGRQPSATASTFQSIPPSHHPHTGKTTRHHPQKCIETNETPCGEHRHANLTSSTKLSYTNKTLSTRHR